MSAPVLEFSYERNFVKLPRELLRLLLMDKNMLSVYLVCLDRARYRASGPDLRPGRRIVDLGVGQLVAGRKELGVIAGITTDEARGALQRLQKLKILTIQSTKRGTIITMCGYGEIADDGAHDSPTGSPTVPPFVPNSSPTVPPSFPTNKKGRSQRRQRSQEGEGGGSRPPDYSPPSGMGDKP